jgi:hypothetical protein
LPPHSKFDSLIFGNVLPGLTFLCDAQMTLQGGCGRLWKSAENVTAKIIARMRWRTYLEARHSTNARSLMSTWCGGFEGAIGHRGMRLRHECAIADVNVQGLVAGAR